MDRAANVSVIAVPIVTLIVQLAATPIVADIADHVVAPVADTIVKLNTIVALVVAPVMDRIVDHCRSLSWQLIAIQLLIQLSIV